MGIVCYRQKYHSYLTKYIVVEIHVKIYTNMFECMINGLAIKCIHSLNVASCLYVAIDYNCAI